MFDGKEKRKDEWIFYFFGGAPTQKERNRIDGIGYTYAGTLAPTQTGRGRINRIKNVWAGVPASTHR